MRTVKDYMLNPELFDNDNFNEIEAYHFFSKTLNRVRLPIINVTVANNFIDRLRRLEGDKLHTSLADYLPVSSTNYEVLEKISGGRANLPRQSVFYGSLRTEENPYSRITALTEVSANHRRPAINKVQLKDLTRFQENEESSNLKDFFYSFSRWEIRKPLELAVVMPFGSYANSMNRQIMEQCQQKFNSLSTRDKELIRLLSDSFLNNKSTRWKYYFSAYYANCLYREFDGILYPSMQSNQEGQNIVLRSDVVLNKLSLDKIALLEERVINDNKSPHTVVDIIGVGDFSNDDIFFYTLKNGVISSTRKCYCKDQLKQMAK